MPHNHDETPDVLFMTRLKLAEAKIALADTRALTAALAHYLAVHEPIILDGLARESSTGDLDQLGQPLFNLLGWATNLGYLPQHAAPSRDALTDEQMENNLLDNGLSLGLDL